MRRCRAENARHFKADVKVFVDTAAVMEKPLARAAGLGWQGKHTNLVSRRFLGVSSAPARNWTHLAAHATYVSGHHKRIDGRSAAEHLAAITPFQAAVGDLP